MEKDYYQILGVSSDAQEKDIKKSYHQKARELHPDKAKTPEERTKFEQEFAAISKAYNVLKEADKRAEYDKQLKADKEKELIQQSKPQAFSTTKKEKEAVTVSDILKSSASATKQAAINVAERTKIAQKAYTKGVQLYNSGDYFKALEFFEAAINNDDTDANYHVKLAVCLIKTRKSFTKAVEAIQTAIDMDPYNMEYKFHLGEIYESAGAASKAKKVYEEILRWDSSNKKALKKLSYLDLDRKKSESFFVNLFKKLLK